ncbi:MAG: CocE/NonD family hydrolase [Thermoleophilaceae bacterium]
MSRRARKGVRRTPIRRIPFIAAVGAAAILGLVAGLPASAAAEAPKPSEATSALGISCTTAPSGVRSCGGSLHNRVPSWDGVPLDATVTLPPASKGAGPYPLIINLHGFAFFKETSTQNLAVDDYAKQGYAVLAYSARGLGLSCGLPISRIGKGCEKGWAHLADARYEARDSQHLAGLLADEGLIQPRKVGVTGVSYGGGQSFQLATLRDRVMLPSGELVPWRSPQGKPMEIAAAAPYIGFSDLAEALVPSGAKLDFRPDSGYTRAGVVKQSYLLGLYTLGGITGQYAPRGADPEADIRSWYDRITAGEPYTDRDVKALLEQFIRYRSARYFQDRLPAEQRKPPAPLLIYNGFTDDIMPVNQATTYAARVKAEFPEARIGMVFADDFGHNRASLVEGAPLADEARARLFARYLLGDRVAKPLEGVTTKTQGCAGQPEGDPFTTGSWADQHPGRVSAAATRDKTFDSDGGDYTSASPLTDPFVGASACRTIAVYDDDGAASYRMPAAKGDGFTLIGAPTISTTLAISGKYPLVVGRLWDVDRSGHQTLVSHGLYRPPERGGKVTFQLEPNGWHFRRGHVAKLELLGRDSPYARASNGDFEITAKRLRLTLPVREPNP